MSNPRYNPERALTAAIDLVNVGEYGKVKDALETVGALRVVSISNPIQEDRFLEALKS